jgi:hypothetical protein
LADLVGRSNLGIRYRPYLGSAPSARLWLDDKKSKAKTQREQEMWNRWAIAEADLDANKETPDNVITYSDRLKGKIKAIDGYELMPQNVKESHRSFYSIFPNPKDRQRIDDKTLRVLKAWYRKYPTPAKQAANPFEDFKPKLSPYQITREALQLRLETFDIKINSKKNPTGQIAAKHYMPLLQKLTTRVMPYLYRYIFNLDPD